MVLKEDDVLNFPPFPKLKLVGYSWTFKILQGYWIDSLTRVDLYRGKKSHDGSVEVKLAPLKTPPSPEQIMAYSFFLENSDAIYKNLLTAVFSIYPEERETYREGYGWISSMNEKEKEEFEKDYGEFVPELKSPEDLKNIICLRIIHISAQAKDGCSYMGFEFDCNWEEEHGLGVLMHGDRVVDVGLADVSFRCSEKADTVDLNDVYGSPAFDESSRAADLLDSTPPENKGLLEKLMKRKGLL